MIEPGGQERPTRHRLLVAMAVSACFIAAVLAVLGSIVDFVQALPGPEKIDEERLTVIVRDDEPESEHDLAADEEAVPSPTEQQIAASDDSSRQQDPVKDDTPAQPVDAEPVIDWQAMAEAAVQSSVDVYFSEKESRTAMWRQTHSIMFKPASELEIKEEEPVIPGFQFKPEIHVFGLGFTIGSCFIGLPLIGVPVEQRSTAMTFFVCAEDAG